LIRIYSGEEPHDHPEAESMSELAKKECIPCKGGVPALEGAALEGLTDQLGNDWKVVEAHHLEKDYGFTNFRKALDFTNRVGELAEAQFHHPDIFLAWGKVKITIWTHKIDGLTESDFIFAAKADQLVEVDTAGGS
jgi:4a-hydroxytetrahydrobiopterin dehydratase